MIIVREADGVIERITGNPTLSSLDGETRAPLKAVLTLSEKERARYGIHIVQPFEMPEGKERDGDHYFEKVGGKIHQKCDVRNVVQALEQPVSEEEVNGIANRLVSQNAIVLAGLNYPVTIYDGHIRIGCEDHPAKDWAGFDNQRIAQMEGLTARKFWDQYREIILKLAGVT